MQRRESLEPATRGGERRGVSHWRLAFFWAIAGAVTGLLAIPYVLAILPRGQLKALPLPLPVILLLQTVQLFFVLLLATYVGLRLGYPMDLDSPLARAIMSGTPPPDGVRRRFWRAAAVGVIAAIAIVAIDRFGFEPALERAGLEAPPRAPRWAGFLVSFYGGIGEELLLRLFVMTLLAWVMWRLFGRTRSPAPPAVFWAAAVLSALIFAVGHLPAAAAIWPITPLVVWRVLALNSVAGIVFGVVFWKWGLEHAMVAHFSADVVLHVVFAE